MDDKLNDLLDEVYAVGFINGQVAMKNKILKTINRDYSLIIDATLLVKVMKKINRIKLTSPDLPTNEEKK